MAQRRSKRLIRPRFVVGGLIIVILACLYGYWAPFPYQPTVLKVAQEEHLNPYLVAAVIRVESRFRPTVVSRRGAVGLMQLMPSTAVWIAAKTHRQGALDLTNPATNIALGTWYLKYLLMRYHQNRTLALAAYNGGPETVDRWLGQGILTQRQSSSTPIPYPETANFVRRVSRFEVAYRIMYVWLALGKHSSWGVVSVAKLMSEETKMKLGERLGVDDIVRQEGWGGVPARQCGNLVREAIRLAEEELSRS
ncbi:MAG: lytic transglycosylase domain-containing protein [Firmicutes bacterium]|nr:lytic transglycosylase domain-containing protein [Bacillota bacterium]